jgi:isopentenyl diphosphate isomerase/L-lactate dehydrogenase-like FMN-dependent dehydrogenase
LKQRHKQPRRRACAYELAPGEEGGTRLLASFRDELRTGMILTGCERLATARG